MILKVLFFLIIDLFNGFFPSKMHYLSHVMLLNLKDFLNSVSIYSIHFQVFQSKVIFVLYCDQTHWLSPLFSYLLNQIIILVFMLSFFQLLSTQKELKLHFLIFYSFIITL